MARGAFLRGNWPLLGHMCAPLAADVASIPMVCIRTPVLLPVLRGRSSYVAGCCTAHAPVRLLMLAPVSVPRTFGGMATRMRRALQRRCVLLGICCSCGGCIARPAVASKAAQQLCGKVFGGRHLAGWVQRAEGAPGPPGT